MYPLTRMYGKHNIWISLTFRGLSHEQTEQLWNHLNKLFMFKGALDKYNIIPQLFCTPLEVFAWVMTACWVLRSRLTFFWRNINISSIFYFAKLTSINTQYSGLWDTLKMMLFTKYFIKWKDIGRSNQLKISVLVWF